MGWNESVNIYILSHDMLCILYLVFYILKCGVGRKKVKERDEEGLYEHSSNKCGVGRKKVKERDEGLYEYSSNEKH